MEAFNKGCPIRARADPQGITALSISKTIADALSLSVGVRNLVESHVDFSNSRNVFVAALILVLAIAAMVGIVLNAVLSQRSVT